MRHLIRAGLSIVAMMMLPAASAAAQERFVEGLYGGLDRADGWELQLSSLSRTVVGTFTRPGGAQFVVTAQLRDDGRAVGTELFEDQLVFFLFDLRDDGALSVGSVPLDSGGAPIPGAAGELVFELREEDGFLFR